MEYQYHIQQEQIKYQKEDIALREEIPTRGTYKFIGWSETQGSETAEYKAGGAYTLDKDEKLFNSAVSTDSNNRYSIYNKKYLLPFGEKVPFATFLNKFGIKPYDELEIFKGKHNKPLYIDNFGKKIVVAPMICYEDIISESLMDNSMKKSNVLVSLSKDTWFR